MIKRNEIPGKMEPLYNLPLSLPVMKLEVWEFYISGRKETH